MQTAAPIIVTTLHTFVGLTFCIACAACILAWRSYKNSKAAFHIIRNRNTRTVTVDMNDGKVTVIKEYRKDDVVDVK